MGVDGCSLQRGHETIRGGFRTRKRNPRCDHDRHKHTPHVHFCQPLPQYILQLGGTRDRRLARQRGGQTNKILQYAGHQWGVGMVAQCSQMNQAGGSTLGKNTSDVVRLPPQQCTEDDANVWNPSCGRGRGRGRGHGLVGLTLLKTTE